MLVTVSPWQLFTRSCRELDSFKAFVRRSPSFDLLAVVSELERQGRTTLVIPPYDTIIQGGDGSWHIPYDNSEEDRSTYEVPQRWLCLTKQP
ncbi:hypothetical protein CRUP_034326 [Coryphaenoides rupestris]|nr:hypothetical protein CRUP_034326 [Coryphaenoides rupestris]